MAFGTTKTLSNPLLDWFTLKRVFSTSLKFFARLRVAIAMSLSFGFVTGFFNSLVARSSPTFSVATMKVFYIFI
jgi:hypothetical protein